MNEIELVARKNLRTVTDQWTSGIRPTWTVAQVKSALYTHQTGYFNESALLVDAMLADDELPSCSNRAVNSIVGAPFDLVPIEDSAASKSIADALGPLWQDCYPEHELASLIHWFLWLGVAVGTLDWDTSQTPWKPHLRVLHPQFLRWESDTWNPVSERFGAWFYNSREGDQMIHPGDGKWIVLSDGRNSWMRSSVRALATTWLVKQFAWRDWQRYNERHGLPIIKAMVPAFASSKEEFISDLRSLGREAVMHLPTHMTDEGAGFDADLLEATDQSWDSFQATIERVDRKFQVHFLGTNSGSELIGTAGSKATSESGRDLAREIAAQRARRITTDLREQLVWPWMRVNIAGASIEDAPWPTFQIEEGQDNKIQGEGWEAMAKAINAWKAAGYEVQNIEDIAGEAGLVLEESEEEPESEVEPNNEPPKDDEDERLSRVMVPRPGGGWHFVYMDKREDEQLDAMPAQVEDVGKREGFVAGQNYVDGLSENLAAQATAVEKVTAEEMLSVIDASTSPSDMQQRLKQFVKDDDPIELAALFEKALLLSQLAGRFAVQEDL